jgi:hypothetical protein
VYTQKRCEAGLDPNDSTWKYLGTNTTYECPDDADTCSDADKIWCYEQAPGKCFQVLLAPANRHWGVCGGVCACAVDR